MDTSKDIRIKLTGKKAKGKYTIVDEEDYKKYSAYAWYLSPQGYVMSAFWKKEIQKADYVLLHRLISEPKENEDVDHINGDKLDNRRKNLRNCTHSENMMNRTKPNPSNTSGATGVVWIKANKKWKAQLVKDTKNIYLGSFINKEDAIKARRNGELKYYGKYSSLFLEGLEKEGKWDI